MRRKIAAGNWKMNKELQSGVELASDLAASDLPTDVDVVVAPSFVLLDQVVRAVKDTPVVVAAQNCSQHAKGAYTGEVSIDMLKSIGVDTVIIGHSERREKYGESDEIIYQKLRALIDNDMKVILCCGEPLEVRKAGDQEKYVIKQLQETLLRCDREEVSDVVVAYEPIWAIGTGETASPAQAQEMHEAIRKAIRSSLGEEVASVCPILYGGSVKPANAKEIFGQKDVDGGLVGGASLKVDDFVSIARSF